MQIRNASGAAYRDTKSQGDRQKRGKAAAQQRRSLCEAVCRVAQQAQMKSTKRISSVRFRICQLKSGGFMVYRVYVENKEEYAVDGKAVLEDLNIALG